MERKRRDINPDDGVGPERREKGEGAHELN